MSMVILHHRLDLYVTTFDSHLPIPIMKRLLSILLMFGIATAVKADRTQEVAVEYTHFAPRYMSYDEAEATAIREAQAQAIAEAFGTLISSASSYSYGTGREDAFSSVSLSDVRGEWVKTIGKPDIKVMHTDAGLAFIVNIKGKVRELDFLKPEFRSEILKMQTDSKGTAVVETSEFKNGESLCYAFTAPQEGYLAMFVKEYGEIRNFIPIDLDAASQKVKAHERTFFYDTPAEHIEMVCDEPREINTFYTIFSTNPIVRPVAHTIGEDGSPIYTDEQFQKWLGALRSHDKGVQVEVKFITISK